VTSISKNKSVVSWLRSSSFQLSGVSRIWSGMIKVIHLITHGLYWIPGNGKQIALGKDRILGMGNSSFISKNLQMLSIFGISRHLIKLEFTLRISLPSTNWMSNIDLGLTGALEKEWDLYRLALIKSGAILTEEKDNLMWSGGDDSGIPTVNFFYLSIIKTKKFDKGRDLEEIHLELEDAIKDQSFHLARFGR
jgi:hypothetical protein